MRGRHLGAGVGLVGRARVDAGQQARARAVGGVVVAQQRRGLRVECRVGVGRDEQAANGQQRVRQAQLGPPVARQRVHAHLARRRHVGVEDARDEHGARGRRGVAAAQLQPHAEHAALVRRLRCNVMALSQYYNYRVHGSNQIITSKHYLIGVHEKNLWCVTVATDHLVTLKKNFLNNISQWIRTKKKDYFLSNGFFSWLTA